MKVPLRLPTVVASKVSLATAEILVSHGYPLLCFTLVGSPCPAGSFCEANTPPNSALICPEDHFCPEGSASPMYCRDSIPDTSIPTQGAQSLDECLCPDGFYRDDNELGCIECPLHHVCTENIKMPCGRNAITTRKGTESFEKCICNAGYVGNGRQCLECGVGNFCPTGSKTRQDCGQFRSTTSRTAKSRLECVCAPGYELLTTCLPCNESSFKRDAGNHACTPLEPLTSAALNGAAWQCIPNAFLNKETKKCEPCPDDTAKVVAGNQTCTACDQFNLNECACFDTTSAHAEMCRRCGQFVCSGPFWASMGAVGVVLTGAGYGALRYYRSSRQPLNLQRPSLSTQNLHRSNSALITAPLRQMQHSSSAMVLPKPPIRSLKRAADRWDTNL
jgi:hypothetical protein